MGIFQSIFKWLQEWRFHILSQQLIMFGLAHGEKKFLVSGFSPIASRHIPSHHYLCAPQEESGSIISIGYL